MGPIYIPSSNQDAFIRRGYYGGHADTYKPYGDNLYYYDVNSLYPFAIENISQAPIHLWSLQQISQASKPVVKAFGLWGSVKALWVPDGDRHLRPGGGAGMVPICLGVPDEIAIQSGLQPRASKLLENALLSLQGRERNSSKGVLKGCGIPSNSSFFCLKKSCLLISSLPSFIRL